jgi:hypothetical protein
MDYKEGVKSDIDEMIPTKILRTNKSDLHND